MRVEARDRRPGIKVAFQSDRNESQMSIAASFTWMAIVAAGLVLLVIWIIEYDQEFQSATATRLHVPVICAYGLLGIRFGAGRCAWRWLGVTGHLPRLPVPENSGVAPDGRSGERRWCQAGAVTRFRAAVQWGFGAGRDAGSADGCLARAWSA